MNALRVTAGAVVLVDSVLGLYLANETAFSGVMFLLPSLLLYASAFLFVDSLLCIYGVHYAFPVAALLSVVLAAEAPLLFAGYFYQELALLALSLMGLALSVLAFRSTSQLSEQANPMNLPVFG